MIAVLGFVVFIAAWWMLAMGFGLVIDPDPDRGEWIEHAEGAYYRRFSNSMHGG